MGRDRRKCENVPEQVGITVFSLNHTQHLALHLVEHRVPHLALDLAQPGPLCLALPATFDLELTFSNVLLGGSEPEFEELLGTFKRSRRAVVEDCHFGHAAGRRGWWKMEKGRWIAVCKAVESVASSIVVRVCGGFEG